MFKSKNHIGPAHERLNVKTFFGFRTTPITRRRIENFKRNRRGLISLWIFIVIFILTMFAEVIANDKPLLVRYNDQLYFPAFASYSETVFGGEFETEADQLLDFTESNPFGDI